MAHNLQYNVKAHSNYLFEMTMRVAHQKTLGEEQIAENYLGQHYDELNKLKHPFLYDRDEVDVLTRREYHQNINDVELKQQAISNNVTASIERRMTVANTRLRRNATKWDPKSGEPRPRRVPDTVLVDRRLKGWRRQQGSLGRTVQSDQDRLALQKYETYVKNVSDTLYATRYDEQRFILEKQFSQFGKNVYNHLSQLEGIGSQERDYSNSYKYLTYIEKVKGQVANSLRFKIKKREKQKMLASIKDNFIARLHAFKEENPGMKPKLNESLKRQSTANRRFSKGTLSDAATPVEISNEPEILSNEILSALAMFQRAKSINELVEDEPTPRQEFAVTMGHPETKKEEDEGELPHNRARSSVLAKIAESPAADIDENDLERCLSDAGVELLSAKSSEPSLKLKMIQAKEKLHLLKFDPVFQIDSSPVNLPKCDYKLDIEKYFDTKEIGDLKTIKELKQQAEEEPIFQILDKSRPFGNPQRLAQFAHPGFAHDVLAIARQAEKHSSCYTRQQFEVGGSPDTMTLTNAKKGSIHSLTNTQKQVTCGVNQSVSFGGTAKSGALNLQLMQTTAVPQTSQTIDVRDYDKTVNTCPQQRKQYRDKVIKNIVRKRQKKIRDVRAITNPGKKYTLKDEAQKFETTLEAGMNKPGAYDSSDCRQKAMNIMAQRKKKPVGIKGFNDIFLDNGEHVESAALEKNFRQYLKSKNMLEGEESVREENFLGYDKFGEPRDPILEGLRDCMLRPRLHLIDRQKGELSLGEKKVFDQIGRLKGNEVQDPKMFRMDSLVESAFNTEANEEWEAYKFRVKQPPVSECSQDMYQIFEAMKSEGQLLPKEEENDQFSAFNQSGSSFSSEYSQKECQEDLSVDFYKNQDAFDQKYTYHKIVDGFKLPMLIGDLESRYDVTDIIDSVAEQVKEFRHMKNRKLSLNFIDKVCKIYLKENGAVEFDLKRGLQVKGFLYMRDYHMNQYQLNALACTLPMIQNLRYLNLENCGLQDEQGAYIIQACYELPKLTQIYVGHNHIGRKFVRKMRNSKLQGRLKELSLSNLKSSHVFTVAAIERIQMYCELLALDLSGNFLETEATRQLGKLLESTRTLKILNLSNCLKSPEASRFVLRSMNENYSLTHLNLSHSAFKHNSSDLGSHVGRMIVNHTELRHLDISHCQLIDEEMLYIAVSIVQNLKLQAIHMGFNNIEFETKDAIRSIIGAQIKFPYSKLSRDNQQKTKHGERKKIIQHPGEEFLLERKHNKMQYAREEQWYDTSDLEQCWLCHNHNHVQIHTSENKLHGEKSKKVVKDADNDFITENNELTLLFNKWKEQEEDQQDIENIDFNPSDIQKNKEFLFSDQQTFDNRKRIQEENTPSPETTMRNNYGSQVNIGKPNFNPQVTDSIEHVLKDKITTMKPVESAQAPVLEKHFNFSVFNKGRNIIPLSTKVRGSLIENGGARILHCANIQAAPVSIKKDKIECKEFRLQSDLLDLSDSSQDSDGDGVRQHKLEKFQPKEKVEEINEEQEMDYDSCPQVAMASVRKIEEARRPKTQHSGKFRRGNSKSGAGHYVNPGQSMINPLSQSQDTREGVGGKAIVVKKAGSQLKSSSTLTKTAKVAKTPKESQVTSQPHIFIKDSQPDGEINMNLSSAVITETRASTQMANSKMFKTSSDTRNITSPSFLLNKNDSTLLRGSYFQQDNVKPQDFLNIHQIKKKMKTRIKSHNRVQRTLFRTQQNAEIVSNMNMISKFSRGMENFDNQEREDLLKELNVQWGLFFKNDFKYKNEEVYLVASFNQWQPIEMTDYKVVDPVDPHKAAGASEFEDSMSEHVTSMTSQIMKDKLQIGGSIMSQLDDNRELNLLKGAAQRLQDNKYKYNFLSFDSIDQGSTVKSEQFSSKMNQMYTKEITEKSTVDKEMILKNRVFDKIVDLIRTSKKVQQKEPEVQNENQWQKYTIIKQTEKKNETSSPNLGKPNNITPYGERTQVKALGKVFEDYVPPGKHYFFFIRTPISKFIDPDLGEDDENDIPRIMCYTSTQYDQSEYLATGITLNSVEIEENRPYF